MQLLLTIWFRSAVPRLCDAGTRLGFTIIEPMKNKDIALVANAVPLAINWPQGGEVRARVLRQYHK